MGLCLPLELLPWRTNPSHPLSTYLISLSHLADDFSRGWVDGGEGFLADCIVPFVIDENLQGKKPSRAEPSGQIPGKSGGALVL